VTHPLPRPSLKGIHHIKLAVSDLDASVAFYQRVFDAKINSNFVFESIGEGQTQAYVLEIEGLGGAKLQLRQNFAQAIAQRAFDPIAVAVDNRAELGDWANYLDSIDVKHSSILTVVLGWALVFEDPDENRIRIFTKETHEHGERLDTHDPWLTS
jgi:catechol 2,3-dioxygenase-like lactoylglutathione lyase family enzyme